MFEFFANPYIQSITAITIVLVTLIFTIVWYYLELLKSQRKFNRIKIIDYDDDKIKYVTPKYKNNTYYVEYYTSFLNKKRYPIENMNNKEYMVYKNNIFPLEIKEKDVILHDKDISKILKHSLIMDILTYSPLNAFSLIMLVVGILFGFLLGNIIPIQNLQHMIQPTHTPTNSTTTPITLTK